MCGRTVLQRDVCIYRVDDDPCEPREKPEPLFLPPKRLKRERGWAGARDLAPDLRLRFPACYRRDRKLSIA